MKSRHEITNEPCEEEGHDEQGEHLVDDDYEGGDERETWLGVGQGKKGRTEQRHYHIDDDGVGRGGCRVASQFLSDDGTCSGCGTDDGEHEALKHKSGTTIRKNTQKEARGGKEQALGEQKPNMPTVGLEVGGLDLAERHEEHNEEQDGLQHLDDGKHICLHLIGKGQGVTYIICQCATEHCHWQCPVFYESDYGYHSVMVREPSGSSFIDTLTVSSGNTSSHNSGHSMKQRAPL